jgi:hypothetical protein
MDPTKVQKGDVAVLLAAAKFTEAGIVVLQPICEALPFDLVLLHDGKFYRAQVKRAQKDTRNKGRYLVPLRKVTVRTDGKWHSYRYSSEQVELIVGVVVPTADVYVFPIADLVGISTCVQLDPGHITQEKFASGRKIDAEGYKNRIRFANETVAL